DVVIASPDADSATTADVGAVFVYRGGAGLSGAKTEDARLSVSGAATGDALGWGDPAIGADQTGATLADVTGDGVLDVVARAEKADVAGAVDVGAIYVWAGGAGLSGPKTETAALTVPGPTAGDRLGGLVPFAT